MKIQLRTKSGALYNVNNVDMFTSRSSVISGVIEMNKCTAMPTVIIPIPEVDDATMPHLSRILETPSLQDIKEYIDSLQGDIIYALMIAADYLDVISPITQLICRKFYELYIKNRSLEEIKKTIY